jgi:hypothetical protein
MNEITMSISESNDDTAELRSLYSAIVRDDDLRPAQKGILPGPPKDGQMGAEDLIRFVAEDAALISALSTCITAWLVSRKSKLKIVVSGPSGQKAEVTAEGLHIGDDAAVRSALDIARGVGDGASR